jgi:hypothetical protein
LTKSRKYANILGFERRTMGIVKKQFVSLEVGDSLEDGREPNRSWPVLSSVTNDRNGPYVMSTNPNGESVKLYWDTCFNRLMVIEPDGGLHNQWNTLSLHLNGATARVVKGRAAAA